MATCDECGKHENMPYQCRRCGQTFCAEHRLPENHNCPGLSEWNDPSGVFDSGFDDSVNNTASSEGIMDRLTGTGGVLGYFRGNMAFTFLGLMWVTFALEWIVTLTLGNQAFNSIFTLTSDDPFYVWTWVTSIFAHSRISFFHIVGNSIVLYFFGPLVERYIGSRKFTLLFLGSGMLAGLSHVGVGMLLEPGVRTGVLGASGAIFAILGVLTVLNPNLKIYLYFLIPIPLWLFTLGFAGLSIVFFLQPGAAASVGQGGVAHFAHLIGLIIGLAYGQRVKGRQRVPSKLSFGGRGGGGPGRRF
ncbi:rhomboid family intramembrane serine protease [Halogeometricum borinquense]|uniref:Rhomboid family intramembrane serine protease n=1 Tax=Halogeometricum borinquense TaxID=60847 RepID=A0A6C0UDF5_9EURY|nr:rhomboid family intramembrane serine protease [Halogeometricum borinquense]QIB73355.1 rhomboid family intramembrane serine protease [Halogeometricum borinquense]QIQ77247.1 rhomboid family intramembrane serine protease [Halogeometricum borinquense]